MANYNLKIIDNKVIFDGHAENSSDCHTLTLLCNLLQKNTRTIDYRAGYAEFELEDAPSENKFILSDSQTFYINDTLLTLTAIQGSSKAFDTVEINLSFSQDGVTVHNIGSLPCRVRLTSDLDLNSYFSVISVSSISAGETALLPFLDNIKLRSILSSDGQEISEGTIVPDDGTKLTVSKITSVDLATAFPDKWAALTPGEHTIQIRAKNPGNYLDSDLSTAIAFIKVVNWTINITATNCTADASNPTVVPSNTTAENPVVLRFNKVTGYALPTTLVLDGIADDGYTWAVSSDGAVGTITIIDPSGNITGAVAGTVETYSITTNLTHATKESGPSTIAYGASATLTFSFPTGYEAPASVTVTGADSSWEAGTGTLTLMKARGPVAITVKGVATTTTLDGGTYKWHDSINLSEWTQDVNFTSNGTSYTAMRYTGNGTAMTLQYRYGGSDWITVYNYDEDSSTGSWVNDAYKIVDLGTSAQTVTAIFKADFTTNTTKLTQLATPQNVTADGTVVSWDEVENATSYEVLADGASIGTVEAQSGETWVLNESLGMTALQKQQVNFTSNNSSFVAIEANTMSVGPQSVSYYTDDNNDIIVCESGTWINTAYRTITFETAPTGALLRWLQANATKQ